MPTPTFRSTTRDMYPNYGFLEFPSSPVLSPMRTFVPVRAICLNQAMKGFDGLTVQQNSPLVHSDAMDSTLVPSSIQSSTSAHFHLRMYKLFLQVLYSHLTIF